MRPKLPSYAWRNSKHRRWTETPLPLMQSTSSLTNIHTQTQQNKNMISHRVACCHTSADQPSDQRSYHSITNSRCTHSSKPVYRPQIDTVKSLSIAAGGLISLISSSNSQFSSSSTLFVHHKSIQTSGLFENMPALFKLQRR